MYFSNSVRLGEWNISSVIDCFQSFCAPPAQIIPIETIIPHELYKDRGSKYNDIALLRLSQKVIYSGITKYIWSSVWS